MTDEFKLIDHIRRAAGSAPITRVPLGIGDDAAVCESPRDPLLLCSDAMVEGVHFHLDWSTPEDIGHKALASTLSDIAAMGGKPLYALVSLALRPGLGAEFVDAFYSGLMSLARKHDVHLVGGDLTRSTTETFIDVTIVGQATHPVSRAGARAGDIVLVSGVLGSARAGLFALENRIGSVPETFLLAHRRPEPRFDVMSLLTTPGLVTSLIDISDGLSSELHHIARASRCGFAIDEIRIPLASGLADFARSHGTNPYDWVWGGGEDYQLLLTVDPELWKAASASSSNLTRLLTPIGVARNEADGLHVNRIEGSFEEILASGWNHFRPGP